MTRNEILRRFPNAVESFIKANLDPDDSGIRPPKQKSDTGNPLVRPIQRKKKSRISTEGRLKIVYRIYSVRPPDYDNAWTKCLTDCLVEAGILEGDDWWRLCGETISEKAYSKEEERVEIEIFKL